MDILFGSAGVAAADAERMQEIKREIGLDSIVRYGSVSHPDEKDVSDENVAKQDEAFVQKDP